MWPHYHANGVELMMDAKPHTQTWQSMAKVEESRQVMSTRLLYAKLAIFS
jgi:hypothetical protein